MESMTTSHPHLVWVNSERLVRSRDMSEVAELVRAAAEGDQAAWNGLVDRYNLLVFPVLLGAGKRLFSEADKDKTKLELVEFEAYSNGIQKQVFDVVR